VDAELIAWILLLRLPRASTRLRRRLIEQRGSACAALEAIRHEALPGMDRATREYARKPDARVLADEQWLLARPSRRLVHCLDPYYPPLLKALDDAPLALWVDGDVAALLLPQLAMVGSRNASRGGSELAHDFAVQFARAGLTITSGLALGIDAAAHRGALAAGGKTLAILGCGLAQIYPAQHRTLAAEIAANGALISEFPPDTPPRAEHFPQRNRVISGMSLGVLVVEASLGSGSLITARLASEQGREVFAIPGSVHHPMARGCHALIRQGAKLVESAQDVLDELGPLARSLHGALLATRDSHSPEPRSESPAPARSKLAAVSKPTPRALHSRPAGHGSHLLAAIGHDPCDVDALIEYTGMPLAALVAELLELELSGHIEVLPGGRYQKIA